MDRKNTSVAMTLFLITIVFWNSAIFINIMDIAMAENPPPNDNTNGIQYIEGDWIVTSEMIYSDEIIILTGNLTITNGGNLTLINVTLMMNCTNFDGEYNIEVQNGGRLNILNESNITDSPFDIDDSSLADYEFMVWVKKGANIIMLDSELHECGWNWDYRGLTIETNRSVFKNSIFSMNQAGIYLNYSNNITTHSNIIFNNSFGIIIEHTTNSDFFGNDINNNSGGGIYSYESSNNTFIENDLFNNSGIGGIYLSTSHTNVIKDNSLSSNSWGLAIYSSLDNKIKNNTFESDITYGIRIYSFSQNNVIENNIIKSISFYGIRIEDSTNNSILSNNIFNNGFYGYYSSDSYNNNIELNKIYNNSYGIVLAGGANCSFSKNEIFNSTYGIYMGSSNNTFITNDIHDNSNIGIAIFFSSKDNFLINNTILKNGDGISISSNSNNNTFKRNIINNNFKNGTYFYGNFNNTFINCSISNSSLYDISLNKDSHATLLNTSFNQSNIYFDGESTITIKWFMNVYVNSSSGNPVRDTHLYIYNKTDDLIAEGITDREGFLKYIAVTERIQNLTMNITHSPYNITAIKGGFIAYAKPEPIMDETKQINVTFIVNPSPLHHIVIDPKGPETYEIGDNSLYNAEGWNDADEIQLNTTWTPVWSVDNSSIGSIDGVTGDFTALDLGSSAINVTSSNFTGLYNTSEFIVIPSPLHHVVITPVGPKDYYINDMILYEAIGWDDEGETLLNTTWTPIWSVDNPTIGSIDPISGEFYAMALGNSFVRVRDFILTSISNTSTFNVFPWPLHHLEIMPAGPESYYIGDNATYLAIGWNDESETQQNTSWTPVWNLDNTSVGSIDELTGEFTALGLGGGTVSVTDADLTWIYSTSEFLVEPWSLHHITISPKGIERYYIGDNTTYIASGWNDAEETQLNNTWTPAWSVGNVSVAVISQDTGSFSVVALGESMVNVTSTSPTEIFNTSTFIVEPWPLHHIVITPQGPENYYVGDMRTYTVVGWNDVKETQMNITWTPIWDTEDDSIATIDNETGLLTGVNLGTSNITCKSSSLPEISSYSAFTVLPWPLHHIEIVPMNPHYYYIGDQNNYTVIGWNDADETQMNTTWTTLWNVNDTSLASINESGNFIALTVGNGEVNVSCMSRPDIFATNLFTINPWPLHHITITPTSNGDMNIGDEITFTAMGWNDEAETQQNSTWKPLWEIEGDDIGDITPEDNVCIFQAKKSGEGTIKCYDDDREIIVTVDIVVKKEADDEIPVWIWLLTIGIIAGLSLILLWYIILRKKSKDGDSIDNKPS